ncbi:MAG TPA: hypothetical protein VIX63_13330 [Vicinamibacterales bacterium]
MVPEFVNGPLSAQELLEAGARPRTGTAAADRPARDERDVATGRTRQLVGHRVVERVPRGQGAEHFVREGGRLGDHDVQPALQRKNLALSTACRGRVDQDLEAFVTGVARKARARKPSTARIRDDSEGRGEVLLVHLRHRRHGGDVAGETGIGHVRAEYGQGGDEARLRANQLRLRGD